MNMEMVKGISDYVKLISPSATIRGGDFPGEKYFIDITLILSQLSFVPKIKDFYERATEYGQEHKEQIKETAQKVQALTDLGRDLPTL